MPSKPSTILQSQWRWLALSADSSELYAKPRLASMQQYGHVVAPVGTRAKRTLLPSFLASAFPSAAMVSLAPRSAK